MAQQKPIAYTSVGFTLGLGTVGGGTAPNKAASSSFLKTLLSSVPAAKDLLPSLVLEISKAKSATDGAFASQRNHGLSHVAATLQAKETNVPGQQKVTLPGNVDDETLGGSQEVPSAAAPKVEVIGLVTDSDSGQVEPLSLTQTTATSPVAPDDGDKDAGNTYTSAAFIPLPQIIPAVSGAAAPAAVLNTAAPGSADALAEEENIRRIGQQPYWMSYLSHIQSPLLRLHQELVELCELVQPTPEEATARREAVAAITEVVHSIWPQARCEVFGSYATGLYVPTSDIDLVILDSGCANVQSGLKALASMLGKRQLANNVQVIGKARVPIIKFETVGYGNLAFDVSFDVANGPQAAQLVTEMTSLWPMMRPLILCLKLFLQQRELNEVYTGGIGSYALITMVASFLQLHSSRRPKVQAGGGAGTGNGGMQQKNQTAAPVYGTAGDAALASRSGGVEPGLGTLLVDFLRFYGRVVNTVEVGVSCASGGQFFRKVDKTSPSGHFNSNFNGWLNQDRAYLLAIEDPKDPENDVCRNSYNIMRVKTAFEFAYQMLTAPARPDESLLARILRLGPIVASRPRPHVPHLRELGYYSQPPERQEDVIAGREHRREQLSQKKRNGHREGEQRQQGGEVLPGRASGDKEGGSGGGTKRRREESDGGAGKKERQGGDKRSSTPTAGKDQGAQEDEKGQLKRRRRRSSTGGGGGSGADAGDGGGGGGGSGGGGKQGGSKGGGNGGGGDRERVPKRRRSEAVASAGTGAGDHSTPAPSAKHSRTEKHQDQHRDKSGIQSCDADGNMQQQQPYNHRTHNQQQQQPRRPGPTYVLVHTKPTVPAPAAVAPIFHLGYVPPSAQPVQRHHHSQQSQHYSHRHNRHNSHQGGGAGGNSRHGQHTSSHHNHHHLQHQQQQSNHHRHHNGNNNQSHDGYSGDAQSAGSMHGQRSAWQRAPLMVAQGQQQHVVLRGQQHQHEGRRTHVFFD